MKNKFVRLAHLVDQITHIRRQRYVQGLALAGAFAATPAFAQISKVNTVTANVQAVLTGVAVTIFTIMIIWAGFKMGFQHAKWAEVSNIVIGGILVGGAAGIAAWLIN
jgi:type IV secretion system protein VirB2